MCARLRLQYSKDKLLEVFRLLQMVDDVVSDHNLPPSKDALIVAKSPEGKLKARRANFGLIPPWAKDQKLSNKLYNARTETVDEKPSFRSAFQKRHCLVPCSGFYEWREENGKKQPYLFERADGGLLMLAGLWNRWMDGDKPVYSFTILTTEPNEAVAPYHHRSPVMLPEENYLLWMLNTPDKGLLDLIDPSMIKVTAMDRAMNRV